MLVLCFLPHSLVRFSISQNSDSFKLWLLYFFAAVALCCPTHLHCSQQQHEKTFWRLSTEFRHLFSTFSGRADSFMPLSSPTEAKQRKPKNCKQMLQILHMLRALLEILCPLSVAQVSQRHQPQTNEQSASWAPEDAALPLFSGDLAVSHLLCSFGSWFS